jgi:hypothetical protein
MTTTIIIKEEESCNKTSWTRILFRCIAYPFIAYTLTIYAHAKMNDPEGFSKLLNAFTFNLSGMISEWNKPIERIASPAFESANDEKNESSNERPWEAYNPLIRHNKLPTKIKENCTIKDDLIEQAEHLKDLAMKCLQLKTLMNQRGLNNSEACFSEFAYTDRALNTAITADILPNFSVPIMTAFNDINQVMQGLNPSKADRDALKDYKEHLKELISQCGQDYCIPLAEALYTDYEINHVDIADLEAHFKNMSVEITENIANVTQTRVENLTLEQEALTRAYIDAFKLKKDAPTQDVLNVHKNALKIINEHYPHMVERKVIPKLDPALIEDLPLDSSSTNLRASAS